MSAHGRCSACGAELPITAYSAERIGVAGRYCGGCILNVVLGHAVRKGEAGQSWISVDDELPEVSKKVLVHLAHVYEIHIATWRSSENREELRWCLSGGRWYDLHDVTHWQPLPEPPVVEQKREVGQCGDCRHWQENEHYYSDVGACYVSNHALRIQGERTVSGFSRVKVRETASNWGCIQFEPKDDNA